MLNISSVVKLILILYMLKNKGYINTIRNLINASNTHASMFIKDAAFHINDSSLIFEEACHLIK